MIMEKVIRLEGLEVLLFVNYIDVPSPNSQYCIFIVTSSTTHLFYQYAVQSNQFISEPLTRSLRRAELVSDSPGTGAAATPAEAASCV